MDDCIQEAILRCAKYHWLKEQKLLRNWPKYKHFTSAKYHSVGPIVTEKLT